MNIVDFIRARLDADEMVARAAFLAGTPGTAHWTADAPEVRSTDGTLVVKHTWPNEATHIARHDPARVLQQCAGLRRVFSEELDSYVHLEGAGQTIDHEEANESTIFRGLASVWSDHPDYRPEWAQG